MLSNFLHDPDNAVSTEFQRLSFRYHANNEHDAAPGLMETSAHPVAFGTKGSIFGSFTPIRENHNTAFKCTTDSEAGELIVLEN